MADLKSFPGGGNVDEFKVAIRSMIMQLDTTIEYFQILAKLYKAKYDALVAEGFTPAQALELSKTLF
jgi:hypothetical protein